MAFCASKICDKVHDKCHHNRRGHADEGHPRPAENAVKNGGHAKGGDSLDQDEACHTANNGDNHDPGA